MIRIIYHLLSFVVVCLSASAGEEPLMKIGNYESGLFARKNNQYNSRDPYSGDGIEICFTFKGEVASSTESSGYILKMLFDAVMVKYQRTITTANAESLIVKGDYPLYFSVEISKNYVIFSHYTKTYNITYSAKANLEEAVKFVDAVGLNRKPSFRVSLGEIQEFSKEVRIEVSGDGRGNH